MLSFSTPISIMTLADALLLELRGWELHLNHVTKRVDAHKDFPDAPEEKPWDEDGKDFDDGSEPLENFD